MHKLASKTMIEILPQKLMTFIEAKCGSLASTPDFFDVIGQVSWYEEESAAKWILHISCFLLFVIDDETTPLAAQNLLLALLKKHQNTTKNCVWWWGLL